MATMIAIEHVSPTALNPAGYNPRIMRDDARARLRRSIAEFGLVDPIIARRSDGLVIGGHQRLAAALELGLEAVPVVYLEGIDDQRAAALNVALNNTALQGEFDAAKLGDLLRDLADSPVDLTLTGFGDEELAALLAPTTAGILLGVDVEDAPPLPVEVITKVDECITLGQHRLVCGDARDPAAWDKLLGDEVVDCVWTDPPYGVAYQTKLSVEEATTRHRRRDGLEVGNDDIGVAALAVLLGEAFALAHARSRPGASWYVAGPTAPPLLRTFAEALTPLGIRHMLLWVKDVFVLGRTDYHYRHEAIWYGWKEGAAHTWHGGRSQDSVLEFPRPRASPEHPTMKPVALVQRCLENSSDEKAIVADPFAGSGSTLLACEAANRRARLIELSPAYCDVIVERWERATGLSAVRHVA